MPPDSRITDIGSHGPMIVTGASNVIDEGKQSSRVGDIYLCPIHGPSPIITGSPKTMIGSAKCARITSITACGAVIVSGAAKCVVD